MSAIAKEKIFEELRNYHTHKFSSTIKNPELNNLRTEFVELEDRILGMLLRLVNGKAEFSDDTKDLIRFQKKLQQIKSDSDQATKELFLSKISTLESILAYAKQSDFKLRKIRPNKYANRVPTNKITVT